LTTWSPNGRPNIKIRILNDLARLAETVREHHGRVDVLFASAGLGSVSDPLGSITPDTFDAMVGVNFRGTAPCGAIPLS
jgi:NAD(P)-dependent dehydrogenase (short-subunit alcohol dehydrogenase family)